MLNPLNLVRRKSKTVTIKANEKKKDEWDDDRNDDPENEDVELEDIMRELKALSYSVSELVKSLTVVEDLRREIQELKCDLRNQNDFMQTIVIKLIEKPTPEPKMSAVDQYKANKLAAAAAPASSATAGPKGKLP